MGLVFFHPRCFDNFKLYWDSFVFPSSSSFFYNFKLYFGLFVFPSLLFWQPILYTRSSLSFIFLLQAISSLLTSFVQTCFAWISFLQPISPTIFLQPMSPTNFSSTNLLPLIWQRLGLGRPLHRTHPALLQWFLPPFYVKEWIRFYLMY